MRTTHPASRLRESAASWPGIAAALAFLCGPAGWAQEDSAATSADQGAAAGAPATSDPCASAGNEGEILLDRMQNDLGRAVCASSRWFDSFFGAPNNYDAYRASYGMVSVGTLWEENEGFEPRIRFQARIQLPVLDRRFNGFIGRVDENDFISGTGDEFEALPSQFTTIDDAKILAGIGYSRPGLAGQIDADAGVHVNIPLNPYVRANYRRAWRTSENSVFRFRQTVFWQHEEGFGTSSRGDWDRTLSPDFMLRASGKGIYAERTIGVEYDADITLFHSLSPLHALAYQIGAEGETGRAVSLQDYGARIIYRRRFLRDYFVLELRGGVGWPKELPTDERELRWHGGLAFEMRFGNWPKLTGAQ